MPFSSQNGNPGRDRAIKDKNLFPKPSIAFVTNQETADFKDVFMGRAYPGVSLLKPRLEAIGFQVSSAVWDNPKQYWSAFDMVLIGPVWMYVRKIQLFREWVLSMQCQQIPLYNSPDFLLWNMDKKYLLELENKGLRIVPTQWVKAGQTSRSLSEIALRRKWESVIVKHTIDAGGFTFSYISDMVTGEAIFQQKVQQGDVLVQKFIPEIGQTGELSFVFLNATFSHAFKRLPAAGSRLVQAHHGGTSCPVTVTAAMIEEANDIVQTIKKLGFDPLYLRLDGVYIDHLFHITEIEGIEPYLEMANAFEPEKIVANAVNAIVEKFNARRRIYDA